MPSKPRAALRWTAQSKSRRATPGNFPQVQSSRRILFALHRPLQALGVDLDRRLGLLRLRLGEVEPQLLFARMVGGDAPIHFLGVVALALYDVGPGLETGFDRLDLGFAVLERIDPVPLRRDPFDREYGAGS
jgi:hypothetical protein